MPARVNPDVPGEAKLLRAVGKRRDDPVRWWVDGRPAATSRWPLRPGTHAIRAVGASGRESRVTIDVR